MLSRLFRHFLGGGIRPLNTKQNGLLEFLVYSEGNRYIGVCLTLDIIEEGDDPANLMESIKEAAVGHVITVSQKNLNDDLLNRSAPKEYWSKYFDALEELVHERERVTEKPCFTFQIPMSVAMAHA